MAASYLRKIDIAWWVAIATWLLFFSGNITGNRYTGWDTHGLGFTNFLYFSDALRNFTIPLWNPLIQGGAFHPSLFNVGNYTPFQWIFIALSYVINPVYAYELMIQATVLLGVVGFYLFLRYGGNDKYISLFGAHAFFLSTLMPITGQIAFIFSLAALPWLLLLCRSVLLCRDPVNWWILLFWAAMSASFMASGYPWMNIVNFVMTFLYISNLVWQNRFQLGNNTRPNIWRCMGFLAVVACLLFCYYLPGYLSMKFYYQNLAGDYVSPEPRLRSLAATWHMSSPGFIDALISSIDPRILKHALDQSKWSWGTGLVIWLAIFYKKKMPRFFSKNLLWVVLVLFWVMYSSGTIELFIDKIPLLKANRWWAIGQYYVSICLIFLAIFNLQHSVDKNASSHVNLVYFAAVSMLILIFLFYSAAPKLVVIIAICGIGFFYCLSNSGTEERRREALILLMCLNIASFISVPITLHGITRSQLNILSEAPDNYMRLVEDRVKLVSITINARQIDTTKEYVADNESWLLNKTSYNHGYNPLSSPLHWYLKSESFTRNLVNMNTSARLEQPLFRRNFASDNAYVEALVNDVLLDETIPTIDHLNGEKPKSLDGHFQWSLKELEQEPNLASIKVWSNDAGYLMFNNTYFPGWEVFVNGVRTDIIRVNKVFMGVYLAKGGDNKIVFKFDPLGTIELLLTPFLVILCSLLFQMIRRPNGKDKIFFFAYCTPQPIRAGEMNEPRTRVSFNAKC
jgi:hypothetical protein